MMRKNVFLAMLLLCTAACAQTSPLPKALTFDAHAGKRESMQLYDGTTINYTAYEQLYYVTNIEDAAYQYLNVYVPDGATQPLKGVPAFDSQIDGINRPSGENDEFGDSSGSTVNFTDYTAQKNGTAVSDEVRLHVRLMNPMSFIGDGLTSVAPHWYIRHGARDRDTAFPVPVNFATKLQNAGKEVDFLLAWNRPHSGDYALDELFAWLKTILKK